MGVVARGPSLARSRWKSAGAGEARVVPPASLSFPHPGRVSRASGEGAPRRGTLGAQRAPARARGAEQGARRGRCVRPRLSSLASGFGYYVYLKEKSAGRGGRKKPSPGDARPRRGRVAAAPSRPATARRGARSSRPQGRPPARRGGQRGGIGEARPCPLWALCREGRSQLPGARGQRQRR